jgi:ligand-binding sensor domain-containing protein
VNVARSLLTLTFLLLGCRHAARAPLPPPPPVSRQTPRLQPGERWSVTHHGSPLPARAALAVGDETWLATAGGILRFGPSLWRDEAPLPLGVIGVGEGLPAAGVYDLALDGGEVLAATDDGLARITRDGRARALAQPRGRITSLAADHAGTWNGLFDLARGRFVASGLSITRLSHCGDRLYLATHDRGLFFLQDGQLGEVAGIGAVHVGDLACAPDGRLWAAAVSGIFSVERAQAQRSAAWGQHATTVAADGGEIVFGTFGLGAFRLHGERLTRILERERISLIHLQNGKILIGSTEGLYRIDSDSIRKISISGPPPGLITALAVTRNGLAAGSFDAGLARLESGRWRALPLAEPRITGLVEDATGRLWIGTASGLWLHDGVRTARVRDPRGWLDRHINALRLYGDELWVGAHPGIVVIAGERRRYLADDLAGTSAYGIAFSGGAPWIGTEGGLTCLGSGSLTDLDGVLPENWINDVRADGPDLWVLTLRSGLVKLGPSGTEIWPLALMTNPSSLLPLGGRVAFGTNSAGLAVADPRTQSVATYGPRQGLSSATVAALAYDAAADRMWIGGSGGIDGVDGLRRRWTNSGGPP